MSESEAFTAIFGDTIKTMMCEVLEEMNPEETEKTRIRFSGFAATILTTRGTKRR